MTSGNVAQERRRAWDVLTQWAGWAGPACLVWAGLMQRQVDRLDEYTRVSLTHIQQEQRSTGTTMDGSLGLLKQEIEALRTAQTASFDDVKQRLSRVEVKLEK